MIDSEARVYAASVSGPSWSVSMQALGHPVGSTATAYVECLAGAASATLTQRAVSTSAQPNSFGEVGSAFCNAGETLVGGGFDLSASGTNLELQSATVETFDQAVWWNLSVINHDKVEHSFTFYAECLSNVTIERYPGLGNMTVSMTPSYLLQQGDHVASSDAESTSVSCPVGEAVAGGGVAYLNYGGEGIGGFGNLYFQHASSAGWQGAIYNMPGYGSYGFEYSVFVVCLTFA